MTLLICQIIVEELQPIFFATQVQFTEVFGVFCYEQLS